ncbi:hypothetical protein [Candidatus Poriferisodalis sp.]|uniref:hypothetical protein n=1 Tax=Candidatus Poriferisodalis sp. TaxID=3101277 RepID=UPI003D10FBA8
MDNDPPKGFTNTDANRDQVKDEIVIRELLQNALDSGTGARTVRFVLRNVAAADIFGLDRYKQAFKHARRYLGADEPPTGQQMIKRIQRALSKKDVVCLFCCDDGNGIGEKELRSLYGSGRSTKRTAGRGSVGHGHLTAFVPSDLRYVLYAGRQAGPDGTLVETFGGHAIIATHIVGSRKAQTQRSADGFIRHQQPDGRNTLFDYERGGTRVPPTLAAQMRSSVAGSAVMIAAYKPVSPTVNPDRLILAAATRHFLVAVFDGTLSVTFTDASGTERSLTPEALDTHTDAITPERRRRAARRTLRTLQDSDSRISDNMVEDALGPGSRVWMRPRLRGDETASHRVSVFRDGMWIQDNTQNYLQPRYFAGTEPFDAVVDLDSRQPGGMGELVRDAEGASHLQITPSELDNPSQLVERFMKLRDLLTANARQASTGEPYAPPQLRLAGSAVSTTALPKRRPKRPDSDPSPGEDVEHERRLPNGPPKLPSPPGPDPDPKTDPEADKEKTDQTVRAGNSAGVSTSCRPDPDDPRLFHVAWSAAGRGFRAGAADLCLAVPSGTDQTSRHRIAPGYLTIVQVRHQQRNIDVPASGRKQVRIPNPGARDTATVKIAAATAEAVGADRGLVEAVLFHRSAASSREEQVTAPASRTEASTGPTNPGGRL